MIYLRWIVLWTHLAFASLTCILDPGLPNKTYTRLGDINLAGIFPISNYDKVKPCGSGLRSTLILQYIEAMVFGIERINTRNDILPNTTLGFVILDDCLKQSTTVSHGISLLPRQDSSDTCSLVSQPAVIPTYDVFGVVGSMKSSTSMALASLLGTMKMPQVSYASTSDELSNTELYPYFLRVVPPDKFQVEAMMSLVAHYNWSYVSVIYTEGSYGEMAFKNIKRFTEKNSICIATENKISEGAVDAEYDKIADNLIQNENARAVVIFTGPTNAIKVMEAIERKSAEKKFIWIGSEAWGLRIHMFKDHWKTALGAFTAKVYAQVDRDFDTYFKALNPSSRPDNPWFKDFWEKHFKCTIKTPNDTCSSNVLAASNGFRSLSSTGPVIDAVHSFALGTQRAINEACPDLAGPNLTDCLNGEMLLKSIKNVTFTGNAGTIKFDENGDILGKYMLEQLVEDGNTYSQVHIATWDALTGEISVFENLVTWQYVDIYDARPVPESVCSRPCSPGEFLIQKELPCCWECRGCRNNEKVVSNGTDCAACPVYEWPEPKTNYTTCTAISPTTLTMQDPIPILLLVLSVLGIIVAIMVLIFYVKYHNTSHIKAASRELSFTMLVGIIVGYLTTIGLNNYPNDELCIINYIGFCLGFSWLYGPLLTRTNRIYRIFETGKKTKQRPPFISPKSQIVISSIIISVQIVLCIITTLVAKPQVRLSMPIKTERYVEKYCDVTLEGLSGFLIYNLILVLICSFFAFKTRKLPDNFNESRFISMCVYTTLVIWLAFIPTYFTTGREYYKTVLLSTALILNDTVALIFLYFPKVYAVLYLSETSGHSNGDSSATTKLTTLKTNSTVGNFVQVKPLPSVSD